MSKLIDIRLRLSNSRDLIKYISENKHIESIYEFKHVLEFIIQIYSKSDVSRFKDYSFRLKKCASTVLYSPERHRLYSDFCRVPWCPMCQWRRSMKWRAKFFELLPSLLDQYPSSRFLFLTLTVPNCPVEDLSIKISDMNKAWQRFIQRKTFRHVLGWVRTLEITREGTKQGFSDRVGYAHPHFHVLLMVSSSYFSGKNYITQKDWQEAWSSSMRNSCIKSVHIKAIKEDDREQLMKQICETLKYSVKVSDMLGDDAWYLEMCQQTYKKRLIASGGVIKGFLASGTDEDDLIDSSPVSVDSRAIYRYGEYHDSIFPYYRRDEDDENH